MTMPSPPSASIHGENNPYQTASSARGDTRPTFAPPPPPPLGQKRGLASSSPIIARPPPSFKSKTLGHLARSTSAEVDNEVAIALASGRSIVSKTDWKEEDAQYLVELIEKQFPKGNIVWDWVGQQMADRGFTKNQCRSKWKRIRTKALLATEYGMKMKDAADENELEDDDVHHDAKSAQKAIMGLTKSLNDFGGVTGDRPSSLLFSNRYQNRAASSSERTAHRAPPSLSSSSRSHGPLGHGPPRSGRYYPGHPHAQGLYDNDGEVDELWSDNEDMPGSTGHSHQPPAPGNRHLYGPPHHHHHHDSVGTVSRLEARRHEYHHQQRHYSSVSPGSSRQGSLSEQGSSSVPRTIFDYSHEPSSSTQHHHHHHHHPHRHQSSGPSATNPASEVTVAVATSEGTGVTQEVLSEIAATPTSFGKIEWKPEDSDYLVELIQTKFKSRKVDWGWIAQQMEGRGYDKAQCKSRWWRVQHRSQHNRNSSQGANSVGTAASSRGKRASISQSDDASIHEDDRPTATAIAPTAATAAPMDENDIKPGTKSLVQGEGDRPWGSAEYEDVDMDEEPVHPPIRLEEVPLSLPVLGKSESQRGHRSTTVATASSGGRLTGGTGLDSPQTPSGPTQKHIEWKEEDSQFMFKMIEREFPVGNIVWSVIAERMASRGYSQTQCMSKWRRHLKSLKKSADEQTSMDIDGIEETGSTYSHHHQQQQYRPAERQGGYSYAHPPLPPPRSADEFDDYDSYRGRKRFNGSEQFQQHAATHFQNPSPYDHPSDGRDNNSHGGPPLSHQRTTSGYSHSIETEYDRYYDTSGHRRYDSYSAGLDYGRTGGQHHLQHARYSSYGSEYAEYADEERRRLDRTRLSEYTDDHEPSGRYRPPPAPPSHGPYAYSPRYPDVESERSRSMDRRREYYPHNRLEDQSEDYRYRGHSGHTSRMTSSSGGGGGMVAPAHPQHPRGEYRSYDERDYRYRHETEADVYAQEDVYNPASKRVRRVQPPVGEYDTPDDYYASVARQHAPPPSARREESHVHMYHREERDYSERTAAAESPTHHHGHSHPTPHDPHRSPLAPPATSSRSHDQQIEPADDRYDWREARGRAKDVLQPTTPPSSAAVPATEYTTPRRSSHSFPAHEQLPTKEDEQHRPSAAGEPSSQWQPMETKPDDIKVDQAKDIQQEGEDLGVKPASHLPPPAETTASTPTPSTAQAGNRSVVSPLPPATASTPRLYDREQKDTTPEPHPPSAASTELPGPRPALGETSPVPPLPASDRGRPPPASHGNHPREHDSYGREQGYYYEDEHYARHDHDRATTGARERDDYYYHSSSHPYGPPPPSRRPTLPPAAAGGEPSYSHPHPVAQSYHTSPPYTYRAEEEHDTSALRRKEWLDRGRYGMSDMQQLAAELERQGRRWETIRREIRIPRLTSPFDDSTNESHIAVDDEYPPPPPPLPTRGHRSLPYGSYGYGGGGPRGHPQQAPPPPRGVHQQHPVPASGGRGGNIPPSQRSVTGGGDRRRSFAADPLSAYPPHASSHDRHPAPPPSGGDGLQPHFSYSHYGSAPAPSGQYDQGLSGGGPHAAKRARSPDAMERDDDGFGRNSTKYPTTRNASSSDEISSHDHPDGGMGHEPSRHHHYDSHQEQQGQQDNQQQEHAHVVRHSLEMEEEQTTNNEAEKEQEFPQAEESGPTIQADRGVQEAELVTQVDGGDDEDGGISMAAKTTTITTTTTTPSLEQSQEQQQMGRDDEDSHEETLAPYSPNNTNTTNNALSIVPLPQKNEPNAGDETTMMVITAGKDDNDNQELKSAADADI